jgi:hypothetical protein
VAGGGGTSTGGVYAVSGTIGQLDASGTMTGGSYSLTGGFWALYAVQTPGAPTLTITYFGNRGFEVSRFLQNSRLQSTFKGWTFFRLARFRLGRNNHLDGIRRKHPAIPFISVEFKLL